MTRPILPLPLICKALAAALIALGTARGQCPSLTADGEWWASCTTMYVYIDPVSIGALPVGTGSGAGTSPTAQVQNAVSQWASVAQTYYGINIAVQQVGSTGYEGLLTIQAVGTYGSSTIASSPVYEGPVTADTITINSLSSVFGSSAAGYQTIFTKVILHEMGHIFGMSDYYYNTCFPSVAATVMATPICGTNDSTDVLPTA
ncbi:MAG: hypothetical protein ABSF22_15395 [Bryobacteraceae bacterium]